MYTRDLKEIGATITNKGFLRKGILGDHYRIAISYNGRVVENDCLMYESGEGRCTSMFRGDENLDDTVSLLHGEILDYIVSSTNESIRQREKWRFITIIATIIWIMATLFFAVQIGGFNTYKMTQRILMAAAMYVVTFWYSFNKWKE